MGLHSKILSILEEHRGAYLSGEEISDALGVSRTAVWKEISKLRNEGYAILAAPHRGYSLSAESDLLSPQGILRCIPEADRAKYNIEVFSKIDSTNNEAKRRIALSSGTGESMFGTVIIADEQEAGRAQKGAAFFSPSGGNIYLTFILPPIPNLAKPIAVASAAAAAVCEAISAFETTDRVPAIRQINDIYLGEKKVCGILTEGFINIENEEIESFILGVGVYMNVPEEAFPAELRERMGSVSIAHGARNQFAAALIRNIFSAHERLSSF
jgi:BirA family biotin operon repressor/biotin-[acetyl-CoA-carboxylase] ligase